MELTATLTYYQDTDSGLQRHRRIYTFDASAYNLDGFDASDYAVTMFTAELNQKLHATRHLGGYWFIWYEREVVATSSGFRRTLKSITTAMEHDHESAATHP